jgi:hypothetical protein
MIRIDKIVVGTIHGFVCNIPNNAQLSKFEILLY